MSSIRTRGQKLKQQQQLGLPASPPLQLATPPRRPRVVKRAPAHIPQSIKQSLDESSEIIFNFSYLPPSPKTPQPPTVLDQPSTEDAQALTNGFPETPMVLDLPLMATDGATSVHIHTASPVAIPAASHTLTVPAASHTMIHFWLDAAQEDLASARPRSDPSIAVALPSALIPDLLHHISRLANSARTNTLTLHGSSVGISPRLPRSNKRKLSEDAESPRTAQRVRVEISQKPKRQKRKGVFSRRPLKSLDGTPTSQATTFTREELYSEDGSLQLGLVANSRIVSPPRNETIIAQPTEAEVEQKDSDERIQPAEEALLVATDEAPMVAQTPTQNQAVAENPRSGRWGLGDLLKSARSVSKFLPGFQRAPPVSTPIVENIATDRDSHLDHTPPTVNRAATIVDTVSQSGVVQARQLENPQPIEPRGMPEIEDSRRNVTNHHNKSSNTGIQVGQKKTERDRKAGALKSKSPESFAENTKNSTSGTKRKRMPSPDRIPNPKGSSYGMDLDYFGLSSSEEEDEMDTPSKPRPSKHRRLRGPDGQEAVAQVGTGKAQSHWVGSFSSGTLNYGKGNAFNGVRATKRSNLRTKQSTREESVRCIQQYDSITGTPRIITNLTGHFRVPSPSSSDSDSDPEDGSTAGPPEHIPTELASKGQAASNPTSASVRKPLPRVDATPKPDSSASKTKTSRTQSPPRKAVTSPQKTAPITWTQPPPPRPNPPHAALPSMSSANSEALARARKKALHYQPHKPSGLRASSRVSSPRILEDSNVAVMEGNKTSTNQIGTSRDIDSALAPRSENAVVNKLGQPAGTSSSSERVESSLKKQVPETASKENSTSFEVAKSPASSYVRDPKIEACIDAYWNDEHTKAASDMFESLYAAFLAKQ